MDNKKIICLDVDYYINPGEGYKSEPDPIIKNMAGKHTIYCVGDHFDRSSKFYNLPEGLHDLLGRSQMGYRRILPYAPSNPDGSIGGFLGNSFVVPVKYEDTRLNYAIPAVLEGVIDKSYISPNKMDEAIQQDLQMLSDNVVAAVTHRSKFPINQGMVAIYASEDQLPLVEQMVARLLQEGNGSFRQGFDSMYQKQLAAGYSDNPMDVGKHNGGYLFSTQRYTVDNSVENNAPTIYFQAPIRV